MVKHEPKKRNYEFRFWERLFFCLTRTKKFVRYEVMKTKAGLRAPEPYKPKPVKSGRSPAEIASRIDEFLAAEYDTGWAAILLKEKTRWVMGLVEQGLISPLIDAEGSGTKRTFHFGNIVEMGIIKALQEGGIRNRQIKKIMHSLRRDYILKIIKPIPYFSKGEDRFPEILLITFINKVEDELRDILKDFKIEFSTQNLNRLEAQTKAVMSWESLKEGNLTILVNLIKIIDEIV